MICNRIICADVIEGLQVLPDESVQCVVTSPPYWGLRDYGVEGQIGLERYPEEYVAKIVTVFQEVRRVLRKDGVVFLNLGDSYATGAGKVGECPGGGKQGEKWKLGMIGPMTQPNRMPIPGLKPKDLVGIPWAVAFALRADGWYLRQDIIWEKGNCMPESVKDRCTKSHEYIFLLSRSEKYVFNSDAIKEPASPESHARYARGRSNHHKFADGGPGNQTINKSFEHMRTPGVHPKAAPAGSGVRANESFNAAVKDVVDFRNKRSVWTINSVGFPEAHFATFPPKLVEPCILAGARTGDIVLDPFMGSGTVAVVAQNLGRRWIGIELNPEYVAMAERRIAAECAQLNFLQAQGDH